MKKILIPTDFSIKSLNVLHSVVAEFNEPLEIVLFHAVYIPGSISDLLFAGKRVTRNYITSDYNSACAILKNKYASNIKAIKTVFFYGSTGLAFNNFLDGQKADCIVVNAGHEYKETYKHSIDPLPLIAKAKMKVLSLRGYKPAEEAVAKEDTLLELLVSA